MKTALANLVSGSEQLLFSDVKTALEDCLTQMEQASSMFENDAEWQQAIADGNSVLDNLSGQKTSEDIAIPAFTKKQMESAVEIANIAGGYGYSTEDSRDTMSQFIEWAVAFEKTPYDGDNFMELIEGFAEDRMLAEVTSGRATFVEKARLPALLQAKLKVLEGNNFDPTSAEDYAKVISDNSLQLKYQDVLDSYFQERIVDIRNALREKGWLGEHGAGSLKNALGTVAVYFKPIQVGAVANVIGGVWKVLGPNHDATKQECKEEIPDDLTKTANVLAGIINGIQLRVAFEISASDAEKIANVKASHKYVNSAVDAKYTGEILGVSDLHVVQSLGRSAAIILKEDLDIVPWKNDCITIEFKDGKGTICPLDKGRGSVER